MILTNKYGFPDPIVEAVKADPYNDGGATISVTRLIAPPQVVVLRERYEHQLQEDVGDRLWATFGQLMHLLLERLGQKNPRYIAEKRMKHMVDIFGHKQIMLSGQLDLYDKQEDMLCDYKFVGEYAFKMAKNVGKDEWEQQLNILRWLLFKTEGILAKRLGIVCLVRDFNAKSESPGGLIEIRVWDLNYTEAYIMDRLKIHMDAKQAPDADLPHCTDEERWFNPKTGKYNRCERYCSASSVCKQFLG